MRQRALMKLGPHIRDFFLHLAQEEKEHVAEAMALINERDVEQKRELDEADTRPEHFLGGEGKGGAKAGSLPAPQAGFTVGSLKGRPEG